MDRELIEYLPPILREIREYKSIMGAEQPEITDLWTKAEVAVNDNFIATASESGIARFEKILSITPLPTDTLDIRRFRVLSRFNENLPYSLPKLHEKLTTLCGADGYTVTIDYAGYYIEVKIALTVKQKRQEVQSLLSRMLPANMWFMAVIMYNTWEMVSGATWGQASASTWEAFREEAV